MEITKQPYTIIVDADACPVKPEIMMLAKQFAVPVLLVASYDHRMPAPEQGVSVVQVDRSDQAADLYIANRIHRGDVLITQDYGLATIGLSKGAIVLSNHGQQYEDMTIDFLLERRHYLAKQRRSGKYGKGPKPFSAENRANFLQALTIVLQRLQENEIH